MSLRTAPFAVIDSETTGTDPLHDRVVSLAVVRMGDREPEIWSTLINPGRPIPPESTAIHGLTDADVADAPTLSEALQSPDACRALVGATPVAYNARFDAAFVPLGKKWLCAMRLAKHLLGDAVADYQLPTVAEHLGVDSEAIRQSLPQNGSMRHQAPFDAAMAASALNPLVDRYLSLGLPEDIERLVEFAERPLTYKVITFGKHEGLAYNRAPVHYLQWLLNESDMGCDPDIRHSVLEALKPAAPREEVAAAGIAARLKRRALSIRP